MSVLRVAMDAEHFRQSDAGIARYARSLAAALRELGTVEVTEVGGGPALDRGTMRKRANTLRQDLLWYPWLGRRAARAIGADVYHSPSTRAPISRGQPPTVVTVHDLVPLRFPDTVTPWTRLYSRATLRRVLRAADRIIVPSNDTANDVISLAGISESQIRVISNGVDARFFGEPARREPASGDYVLFVGTPEPRKNLARLAAAVSQLRQRGSNLRLLIAGSDGWGRERPSEAGVEWLGRVSDDRLHSLYAGASCLALPSLHEGFGLPALEAMAAGTPVLVSSSGALPELVGNAGVVVDPMSVTAIADGIARCVAEAGVLGPLGKQRAGSFTWRACAEATAEVYAELV